MAPLRVALLALAVSAAAVALARLASRLLIYPGSPRRFPPPAELARLLPGSRLVPTRASDGREGAGLLLPPSRTEGPWVLYLHGNAESAADNLSLAAELATAGVGVLLAEYRGYGGLPGRPTEAGLTADAEAALAALEAAGAPPERIAVVGRSLGTGVAVALARRRPPGLLVLVSPFTSAVDVGRLVVGPLAPLLVADRWDSIGALPELRVPVVVVHGARDDVIPVEMGRRLAASRPDVRYLELPDATHDDVPGLGALLSREVHAVLTPGG